MTDREKVIKGLERCLICDISVVATEEAQNAYRECEYTVGLYCGQKKLLRDAIAMLKKEEVTTFKPHYIDKYSKHFICGVECGACCKEISSTYHYCPWCGRQIKWE